VTLELDMELPDGALIDRADAEFGRALDGSGAIWLQGSEPHFVTVPGTGVLREWIARVGDTTAHPVEPNEGHGFVGCKHGQSGLSCSMETNCGFVLDRVTTDASRFSMAVIYLPPAEGEARTLLSLNTGFDRSGSGGKKGGYIFLSDSDGQIVAKDTGDNVGLEMAAPAVAGQPRLVLLTLDRGRLALMASGAGMAEIEGIPPGLNHPASLFIGCRSHRKGLKKTLGSSLIRDVVFWPRSLLLAPRTSEEEAQRAALERYFFWTS
jgi:hypothetical protein